MGGSGDFVTSFEAAEIAPHVGRRRQRRRRRRRNEIDQKDRIRTLVSPHVWAFKRILHEFLPTRIIVYNGHLITAILETLDFLEIF